MKEIKEIIKAFDAAQSAGKATALATVVQVEGSSYRRPGARMLVTEDGQLTGAISGGCLEGDALRKARLAMAQQKPMLVTYDTTDEDDAKLGVGLGCNGIIQILIEPIDPQEPHHPVALLKAVLAERQTAVLVTLFSLEDRKAEQPGTCFLLTQNEEARYRYTDATQEAALASDAKEALAANTSSTKVYTSGSATYTGFVELMEPPVSLVVVGAGNDAIPVTQLAHVLGWEITVVDGRANYATAERFPAATRVLVAKPEQVLQQLHTDACSVFILMTHNYLYDLVMLRQLLPLQLPYIGTLGPKKKLDRMLQELEEEGVILQEEQLQHVFGPTGLDIGAETSEEIALSIVAEVKAVFAGKTGTSLRQKSTPIHAEPGTVRTTGTAASDQEREFRLGCAIRS